MSLSFLTLNIERRNHLHLVKAFLQDHSPDVICFQEIFKDTVEELKTEFEMKGVFSQRAALRHHAGEEGVAILSKFPIKHSAEYDYEAFSEQIPGLEETHLRRPISKLLLAEIEKDGQIFCIATTHFTWSRDGLVTEEQAVNMRRLLAVTRNFPKLILAGDFNTPRGKELYTLLSEHFTDNIPSHVQTTIDGKRHRAGHLPFVVDGVFSRGYTVSEVVVRSGLSDHCGVTAVIS